MSAFVTANQAFIISGLGLLTLVSWAFVGHWIYLRNLHRAVIGALVSLLVTGALAFFGYPAMVAQDAVYLGTVVLLIVVLAGLGYGMMPDRKKPL